MSDNNSNFEDITRRGMSTYDVNTWSNFAFHVDPASKKSDTDLPTDRNIPHGSFAHHVRTPKKNDTEGEDESQMKLRNDKPFGSTSVHNYSFGSSTAHIRPFNFNDLPASPVGSHTSFSIPRPMLIGPSPPRSNSPIRSLFRHATANASPFPHVANFNHMDTLPAPSSQNLVADHSKRSSLFDAADTHDPTEQRTHQPNPFHPFPMIVSAAPSAPMPPVPRSLTTENKPEAPAKDTMAAASKYDNLAHPLINIMTTSALAKLDVELFKAKAEDKTWTQIEQECGMHKEMLITRWDQIRPTPLFKSGADAMVKQMAKEMVEKEKATADDSHTLEKGLEEGKISMKDPPNSVTTEQWKAQREVPAKGPWQRRGSDCWLNKHPNTSRPSVASSSYCYASDADSSPDLRRGNDTLNHQDDYTFVPKDSEELKKASGEAVVNEVHNGIISKIQVCKKAVAALSSAIPFITVAVIVWIAIELHMLNFVSTAYATGAAPVSVPPFYTVIWNDLSGFLLFLIESVLPWNLIMRIDVGSLMVGMFTGILLMGIFAIKDMMMAYPAPLTPLPILAFCHF
ncbi:hypothetical protein EJ08DRAFT_666467 [Tothia fuscella]|uniref:Uncharacterized protein n=1 Tax=Tothia fuscella TaxID=1048955 RepID=A0A9P4NET4_9PEZI|nr:hypothetical protein EJ08DRAFT_666467 [Tothia fuscella]